MIARISSFVKLVLEYLSFDYGLTERGFRHFPLFLNQTTLLLNHDF